MGRQRAQRAGGSGRARRDSPRVISIVIIATSCRICSGNSLGAFRVIVSEGFTHYIRVVTFEWPCSLLGAREASKAQPDQQRREFHATTTEKFLGPECDIEKSETDIQKIQCGIQFFSVSDSAR